MRLFLRIQPLAQRRLNNNNNNNFNNNINNNSNNNNNSNSSNSSTSSNWVTQMGLLEVEKRMEVTAWSPHHHLHHREVALPRGWISTWTHHIKMKHRHLLNKRLLLPLPPTSKMVLMRLFQALPPLHKSHSP